MGSVNTRNIPNIEKQNLTKNDSNLLVLNYHLIKKCLDCNIRQTYGEGNISNLDFITQKTDFAELL